ncbi:hypothetical protein GYMLUDRAFT_63884 [Collybiopsis luxurians FD-317 M1]|uniref:Uncharacterized protein n=1 Tax=Collybiopsis luxurians FD-317 M1 TaxID=944289 RepID=A0A0D0ARW5_9AGAR|nr:hypothetical protein GYMLUDRAFT_63884 [Collybiopsis luxurians FD-317 M1]
MDDSCISKDLTSGHDGSSILEQHKDVNDWPETCSAIIVRNGESPGEGVLESEREHNDHEGQGFEEESIDDEGSGEDTDEEAAGPNFAVLFCSATVFVSRHLRNPDHFTQFRLGKIMVVIYNGNVGIYIGYKNENKPVLAVPTSGDFNELFLEWEIHRRGLDLRMDLSGTS